MKRNPRRPPISSGFSLIEVVLALGIMSVGLVVILGLLPTGLDAGKQVSDETVLGLVVSEMFNERRATPYDQTTIIYGIPDLAVDVPNPTPFYIDKTGTNYLDNVTTVSNPNPYYRFSAEIKRSQTSPSLDLAVLVVTVDWPVVPTSSPPYPLVSNANHKVFISQFAK